MSPEKESLSRAEQVRRRREDDSKQRLDQSKKRTQAPAAVAAPVTRSRNANQRPVVGRGKPGARRYEATLNMPLARGLARNAGLSSLSFAPVEMGPRWFSGLLALICMTLLFVMWAVPPFTVGGVNLTGAKRIGPAEVAAVTGMLGKPGVMAIPAGIEESLRAAFPEFSRVQVSVGFPASIDVTVAERVPVAAWQYNNQLVWIDADGVSFPARGTAENLIPVMALGQPPAQSTSAAQLAGSSARAFIPADTVQALQALQPHVPQGAMLIYDPAYGLGWTDPRGWQAYFGFSGTDVPIKLQEYATIVDNLTQREIQPTLISVAFANAPFYRTEP